MDDPTRSRNLPTDPETVNDRANTPIGAFASGAESLDGLWQHIRAEYADTVELGRRTMAGVHRGGALLIEAKARTEHGDWLPRLTWAGIAPRTAQRFMRIASNYALDEVCEFASVDAAERALSAPRAAKPYRPTGPVLDMAAAVAEIGRLRESGMDSTSDDVCTLGIETVHVRQTGRLPSRGWWDDDPCSYCDCFAGTRQEQIDAWHDGRGPDPWKCPKGDSRWRCEAEGDAE